jgi:hypothetical protein
MTDRRTAALVELDSSCAVHAVEYPRRTVRSYTVVKCPWRVLASPCADLFERGPQRPTLLVGRAVTCRYDAGARSSNTLPVILSWTR